MSKLFKTFNDCEYPDDVRRIVKAAATIGYFLKPHEAEDLWENYSAELCASWLFVPDSEQKLATKLRKLIEEDEVPSIEDSEESETPDIIDDGFGNAWSAWCPTCQKKSMQIVRPGKVQCGLCG